MVTWHKNIIYSCERPYSSVEEMNEDLIARWNSVVQPDDKVWHLGDFALKASKEQVTMLVNRLNGHIRLVMGNHDCHSIKWYQECGFNRVYDRPVVWHDFWILSHQPPEWTDMSGPYAWLYGHVHNRPEFRVWSPRTCNVGVDVHNFTPIKHEQILNVFDSLDGLANWKDIKVSG